jgi:glycine cleavage system H protein
MTAPKDKTLPPQELRCVWMTAGILTYRLCDRDFDCDGCLLNTALHRSVGSGAPGHGTAASNDAPSASKELRKGCLYDRNHCWARELTDSRVRVGLEPGLAQALLTPKAFVLPRDGQYVQRQQTCTWIVIEGGTLPIEAPCTGIVCAANRQLIANPHLLAFQPFDEGWLLEISLKEPFVGSGDFLNAEKATSAYAADQNRFQMMLSSACQTGSLQVGPTLADGGQLLQEIAAILGPGKYFSVLRKAFSPYRKSVALKN